MVFQPEWIYCWKDGLFGKFVQIKLTSTWQFWFPEPNTHLVNCETLKLFIEGPCKGHWCGSWSNKAQLLWSHLLQLSNRGFFWLLKDFLYEEIVVPLSDCSDGSSGTGKQFLENVCRHTRGGSTSGW